MCIGPRENVVMPMDWQPRPIIKSREVKPQEYEKNQLELMILRDEVDRDWDNLDNEIWVKSREIVNSIVFHVHLHNSDFILFIGKCR